MTPLYTLLALICSKISEGGVINMNLGPLSKELELNFYLLNSKVFEPG